MDSISQDSISASGRVSEKLNLPNLQRKMKYDPEGYESELNLIYNQFKSLLELFERQASLNFTSLSGIANDPTVARDLGDRSMFLAHVTQFYPKKLFGYPNELALFLSSSARCLPSGLRVNVTRALVLLANRKMIDIPETLVLFVELQTLGDRALKKLAFSHVIQSIWRMNRKHKNDPKNRALQNVLYRMLQQQEEEAKAKVALVTLCDLHRRKVWFDERTANAICMACFHSSSRIVKAALSFLLDFEKILDDDDDSNDSGGEDNATAQLPQIALTKEAFYKASHKGTASSKKKKKAKLLRVARSMKKKQRLSLDSSKTNNYSPLNQLKDTQGFAEILLSRLQNCNERFEVKMMLLEVIARTVGLHRLVLLKFYPYLQKYVQPYQRHIARLLGAAMQACHDMVPPDAVEPLFKQIVNQFVHDRSRPEAIAVGLRTVHEICSRMPLLMTEDLLQDLVLYDNSKEQGVRSAARALLGLFRVVCPSLLSKKDRGRPINPEARPKAYGEVNVASDIPDIELLEQGGDSDEDVDEESGASMLGEDYEIDGGVGLIEKDGGGENEGDLENKSDCFSDNGFEMDDNNTGDEPLHNEVSDEDDCNAAGDENDDAENSGLLEMDTSRRDDGVYDGGSKAQKRKVYDFEEELNAADKSLQALKKLARVKYGNAPSDAKDGILSNEVFERIKELKAKEEARIALTHNGFKLPSSEQLRVKRVYTAKLDVKIKQKLTKEQKLALIRAGREERGEYQARTAIKRRKTGGMSNEQKEHKKLCPLQQRELRWPNLFKRRRNEQRGRANNSVGEKHGNELHFILLFIQLPSIYLFSFPSTYFIYIYIYFFGQVVGFFDAQ